MLGILGCVLCIVGSTTIVLHAPEEREVHSVKEVWHLALEPGEHNRDQFENLCPWGHSMSVELLLQRP